MRTKFSDRKITYACCFCEEVIRVNFMSTLQAIVAYLRSREFIL